MAAAAAVPNRYIVEMTGEPVAVHVARHARASGIRGQAALARRAQIREEQRPVRARIEAEQGAVVESLDTVANALIVNIPDGKAAALRSLPGVLHVYPARRFRLALDHALPLHHVPEAWQQVGLANAGAGVKIAMIDTGIDVQHPGFQDPALAAPDGFPRVNADSDLAYTNNKVIVARSYASLFENSDPDPSARDRVGHGTATAMAAGGAMNTGPLATISGVAPKAWLGSYKVFGTPGVNDSSNDTALLKAIDDAVADGMDVINLSLGSLEAARPGDDLEVQAIERASALGVIVVVVAGNDGPDPDTIDSPGTSPSAITVGAARNDRLFAATASIAGGEPALAIPGSGANSAAPISGPLAPVAALDPTGLACQSLPAGSLTGKIAFILRGQCNFEVKLDNVQSAGAIAALVYADPLQQDPFVMGVGAATLPASMIGNADGVQILQQAAGNPAPIATLTFTLSPLAASTGGLVGFSSQGPSVDLALKPDLVAVGANFYTAAQKFDPNGVLYDPSGYTITQGTSFSAPLVAGAAAFLKSARPGLTNAQYKSLLVNSAGSAPGTVTQTGAGALNLSAALNATAAAAPTMIDFGKGGANPNLARALTISNTGAAPAAFELSAVPQGSAPIPALSGSALAMGPGESAQISLNLTASALSPGQYQGYIRIADTTAGREMRVPYWYAVPSGVPATITVLNLAQGSGQQAQRQGALLFRVTDTAGIAMTNLQPAVTVVTGSATVSPVSLEDNLIPGAFAVTLRSTVRRIGSSVLRIRVGDVTKDVTVSN